MRAVSAHQNYSADCEEDLYEARQALDLVDGKIWAQLQLTQLPALNSEQLLNAAVWDCVRNSVDSDAVWSESLDLENTPAVAATYAEGLGFFQAEGPPVLVDEAVLGRYFDLDFLRRTKPLIAFSELSAIVDELEDRADEGSHGVGVTSTVQAHEEALLMYQRCIRGWEVCGDWDVCPKAVSAANHGGGEALARAIALQRLWGKVKALEASLGGTAYSLDNARGSSFVFDSRDAQSASETNLEIIDRG
jgi:hypothetical protein